MIDLTAELFKGELGTIKEIYENYSLKEIAQFRDVRIERKKKEEEAEKERQEKERRKREREESRMRSRSRRR